MQPSADTAADLKGLHDVNQSAQIVGCSHWCLRWLVKRGRVAFIRQGPQRRLMFEARELLRLMEERKRRK